VVLVSFVCKRYVSPRFAECSSRAPPSISHPSTRLRSSPHRERDVENLSFYFENRLLRGVTPPHILITGPSGSGKTATVKHVLAKHRVPGFVAYTRGYGQRG